MKNKIIRYGLLFLLLCGMMLIISASAAEASSPVTLVYEDQNKTVIFSENSKLNGVQKQEVADSLVYGTKQQDPASKGVSLCSIFGHSFVSENVYTIEHKVRATRPRCRRYISALDTCSRCGYFEITPLGSELIDCCPVD